jgi:hypothetical protein
VAVVDSAAEDELMVDGGVVVSCVAFSVLHTVLQYVGRWGTGTQLTRRVRG